MARPLRVEVIGGWYHVTARGNARQALFLDDRDRRQFLDLLSRLAPRFGVVVVAYVLMPNHYHLMVRTPEGRLSRALQWLNTSYGLGFNRRHGRSGHVFEGRFKSILVEGDGSWVLSLSVYLHLNPVRVAALGLGKATRAAERAGVAKAPTVAEISERLDRLRRHRWSSYPAYAGYAPDPDWLDAASVLGRFGRTDGTARRRYRELVEGELKQGVGESPWTRLQARVVLGSEAFWRSLAVGRPALDTTAARPWIRRATLAEVIEAVANAKGERWPAFRDRHGDWGRDLVLALARDWTALTLAELGRQAGGLTYAAVAQAVRQSTKRRAQDAGLRRAWGVAEAALKSQISRSDPRAGGG
jgi:REP element-mobilizing transposase RayT